MSTNTIKISANFEFQARDQYYGTFMIIGRNDGGERLITTPVDLTGLPQVSAVAALRGRAEMFREAATWMDQAADRLDLAAEAAE
jgi:hypothetical protein